MLKCPRDGYAPEETTWMPRDTHPVCAYCGSHHPDTLFKAIADGAILVPTDKNYKVYFRLPGQGQEKFYFAHFNEEQKRKFIDLLNSKSIKFAIPGYFYVPPYFIRFS